MPHYRLLFTRRNSDGSFDIPWFDEGLLAPDDDTAALRASRFPVHRFVDRCDFAWLVDETGGVVWTTLTTVAKAA